MSSEKRIKLTGHIADVFAKAIVDNDLLELKSLLLYCKEHYHLYCLLYYCVYEHGSPEVLEILLKKWSSLYYKNSRISKFLISEFAYLFNRNDIEIQDIFMTAIENSSNLEIIKLLVKYGANPYIESYYEFDDAMSFPYNEFPDELNDISLEDTDKTYWIRSGFNKVNALQLASALNKTPYIITTIIKSGQKRYRRIQVSMTRLAFICALVLLLIGLYKGMDTNLGINLGVIDLGSFFLVVAVSIFLILGFVFKRYLMTWLPSLYINRHCIISDSIKSYALNLAAISNNSNALHELLECKANANRFDGLGGDALAHAIHSRNANNVRDLVENGAKVNHEYKASYKIAQYNTGIVMTGYPILCAVRNSDSKIFEYLINKGIDVNVVDNNGETPLLASFNVVVSSLVKIHNNGDSEGTERQRIRESMKVINLLKKNGAICFSNKYNYDKLFNPYRYIECKAKIENGYKRGYLVNFERLLTQFKYPEFDSLIIYVRNLIAELEPEKTNS